MKISNSVDIKREWLSPAARTASLMLVGATLSALVGCMGEGKSSSSPSSGGVSSSSTHSTVSSELLSSSSQSSLSSVSMSQAASSSAGAAHESWSQTYQQATYSGDAIEDEQYGLLQEVPSKISWKFTAPVAGEYRVTLVYGTPFDGKTNHVAIAGNSSAYDFEGGIEQGEIIKSLALEPGEYEVALEAKDGDWGYMVAHAMNVELLGSLTIHSPQNFDNLATGENIEIAFDKTGGDLIYSVNGGVDTVYSGPSPLVIATQGDDIYRVKISVKDTQIQKTLRVTVGNPPANEFVEVSGTQFVLNGKPWYFNGTNQYYLMFKPKQMADDFFKRVDHLGMNVVRTWAFCHHSGTHDGACVNIYDGGSSANAEQAKEHFLALKANPTAEEQAILDFSWGILDNYVARAEEHGIKLILALGDNWPGNSMGGLDVFARAVGGNGITGAYANAEARKLYKMWIDVVLNHTNSITGVKYKDDPTIMAWELANEPRCTGGSGCLVGSVDFENFNTWIAEVSAHIKEHAPQQLVSIGTELDNSDTDAFAKAIHAHDSVDLVSAHLYPKPWNLKTDEAILALVQSRIDVAKEIGKPLYYGEFSYRMEQSTAQADALHRAQLFDALYDLAFVNRNVLGGMINWQLSGLEWGNGNVGTCQWCSGPYGEFSGGWYGNHDGYQFYCTLNDSEKSITGVGASGTNVEGSLINLDWHQSTCDSVARFSTRIKEEMN